MILFYFNLASWSCVILFSKIDILCDSSASIQPAALNMVMFSGLIAGKAPLENICITRSIYVTTGCITSHLQALSGFL
jgi:hypothetical protein